MGKTKEELGRDLKIMTRLWWVMVVLSVVSAPLRIIEDIKGTADGSVSTIIMSLIVVVFMRYMIHETKEEYNRVADEQVDDTTVEDNTYAHDNDFSNIFKKE